MSDAELLGADLRKAREDRELSLGQAEQQTRIRAYYLEALETGHFEVLPSPVQGRGFLRNYSRLLGLDPDVMASRFDAALNGGRRRSRVPQSAPPVISDPPRQRTETKPRRSDPKLFQTTTRNSTPAPEPMPVAPVARTTRSRTPPAARGAEARQRRNRNTAIGTLLMILVSLIALIGLLIYAIQSSSLQTEAPILTTQPTSAQTDVSTDIALTPTKGEPTSLPNPNTVQPGDGKLISGVIVQITIKERSQLKVYADGVIVYSGVDAPGTVLQYQGKDSIRIECSNATGIDVTVNGVSQGELGQRKQKIDKTFTVNSTPPTIPAAVPTTPSTAPSPTRLSAAPTPGGTLGGAKLTVAESNTTPTASLAATLSLTPTVVIPTATMTATMTASPTRNGPVFPRATITAEIRHN